MFQRDPSEITRLETDELTTGIFAGIRRDGSFFYVASSLTYDRKLSQLLVPVIHITTTEITRESDGWELKPYGDSTVWREIQGQQTDRGRQIWAQLQKISASNDPHPIESIAIRVAESSVTYSENGKVGGKIDAAAIDSSGTRWIRRKCSCPEN